jgi:glycosyltransferase involved in cell wall biosynthesis
MRKIKICFLIPSHWSGGKGGAELQANYILEYLEATGRFDVHYICRHYEKGLSSSSVHVLPKGLLSNYCHFNDRKQIFKYLEEIEPDFIYQRVQTSYVGIAAQYCSKKSAKLIFHVAHTNNVQPKKTQWGKSFFFDYIENSFKKMGLRNADYIVCQTEDQAKMLKHHFFRDCDLVMPNVSPDVGCKSDLNKNDVIKVLWVANIKPSKAPSDYIDIAESFSEYPNIEFHMVGKIKSEYGKKIEARAQLQDRMVFHGELEFEKVNELLAESSVFINTSGAEGFPNTFIQSWLNETPVLSLHVDPDSLLTKHELGMFCNGDIEVLKKTLQLWVEDKNIIEGMKSRCRDFASDYFSINNIQGIVNIIDESLASDAASNAD